jgi:hypothetical protein
MLAFFGHLSARMHDELVWFAMVPQGKCNASLVVADVNTLLTVS